MRWNANKQCCTVVNVYALVIVADGWTAATFVCQEDQATSTSIRYAVSRDHLRMWSDFLVIYVIGPAEKRRGHKINCPDFGQEESFVDQSRSCYALKELLLCSL